MARKALWKTMILYALALALAATALQWIEYQYLARSFSTEITIVLIAIGFAALGMWTGQRLTRRTPAGPFEANEAAIRALGISPNTVKTHVARLFEKLGVERRTQAIRKARSLALIP